MTDYTYCPQCACELAEQPRPEEPEYSVVVCPDDGCDFVFYDNPTPVVAGLVETPNATAILVQNHGWPESWYGLVSGFLEKGEAPEEAVIREVQEEIGLAGRVVASIGQYTFERMNQVIMAYHVRVDSTEARPGPEIAAVKHVPIAELRPWPMGTGHAVSDWLEQHRGSLDVAGAPDDIAFMRGAEAFSIEEIRSLYASVGWTRHAEAPEVLQAAIDGSDLIVTALDETSGELVGLLRAISDGAWIAYLQEILVRPSHRRRGIGEGLMKVFLDTYEHVHQRVLLTDDRADQHSFYEASGFVNIKTATPALNAFVLMDGVESG